MKFNIFMAAMAIILAGCLPKPHNGDDSSEPVTHAILDDVVCEPKFDDTCPDGAPDIPAKCFGIRNLTTQDRQYSGVFDIEIIENNQQKFEKKEFAKIFIPAGAVQYIRKRKCLTGKEESIVSIEVKKSDAETQPDQAIKNSIAENIGVCIKGVGISCDNNDPKCLIYDNNRATDLKVDGYTVVKNIDYPYTYDIKPSTYEKVPFTGKEIFSEKPHYIGQTITCDAASQKPTKITVSARMLKNSDKETKSTSAIMKKLEEEGVFLASCKVSCDNRDGNCFELSPQSPQTRQKELKTAIKKLNTAFEVANNVTAAKLEALLNIKNPSCSIGNLKQKNGVWSAQQQNCGFRTKLNNRANIHGEWGNEISLIHIKQSWGIGFYFIKGPQIWFLDKLNTPLELYNSAIGGEVVMLEADSTGIYFGNGKGCMKYIVKKNL